MKFVLKAALASFFLIVLFFIYIKPFSRRQRASDGLDNVTRWPAGVNSPSGARCHHVLANEVFCEDKNVKSEYL